MTVDHFQPRSQGGGDETDNLVYCCHACNEFKGDYWQPNSPRRILHPLRDNIAAHVALTNEDTLASLTETGEFHIRKLRLNRSELIEHRRDLRSREQERLEQQAVLNRLTRMEQRIEMLQKRVASNRIEAEDEYGNG